MRRLLSALTLVCGLLGIAVPASAQGVIPSGAFTSGHTVRCQNATCTVVVDAGNALGSNKLGQGYLTELGITNTGTPFCINDALTSGAYHQFCFGANSLGGGLIAFNNYNGAAPLPLQVVVNGVFYPFPGAVTGMPNVAGNTALKALAHTFAAEVVRQDYESGYGAPPLFFTSSASPCSLNAGAGDGGSQVPTNDGGCWLAQLPPAVDWREWGVIASATDIRATYQAALDATFTAGRKLMICGAGVYKTSTVYFYTTPIEWCDHTVIVKRINAGPVMVFGGGVVGGTYPNYPQTTTLQGFDLSRATIDMNSTLLTTAGGAGIVASAAYDWSMYDPWVWNIPTMTTPSGVVSGAPRGTWAYTAPNVCTSVNNPCNAAVTGWVENAGIALLGGPVQNLENGKIWKGMVGNFAYPSSACDTTLGSTGILFGVPSQMMQFQSSNPANGNTIENTLYDCNQIGIRNDYASGVTILQADTTSKSGLVGITNGTYGRYDVTVSGTASGTSNVAVTMMADGLTGTPLTVSYTGTGGSDTAAGALVSAINGSANLAAYNVTAAVWPGCDATSCTFHIDYGDEFSTDGIADPPLNFNFCGLGSPSNNTHCSGNLRIGAYHTSTWNWIQQTPSELNTFAYVYDGANAGSNAVVQPQQLTGTPYRVHNHAGQGGSVNPINIANFGKNAGNAGATVPVISDCAGDQSPLWVSTGSGPVSTTLWGLAEGYTKCRFKDTTTGGGWGTNAFTALAPTTAWGNYTVNGQAAQTYIRNYGSVELQLYPVNNNTITTAPGNNAGGDWVDGGDANAVLDRKTTADTNWTSSTADTQIGSGAGHILDLPLSAGTSYNCRGHLFVTASGAGGIAVRFVSIGGLSIASMRFDGVIRNGTTTSAASSATALNSDIVGFSGAATSVDVIGSITTNAGGTMSFQAAQNASNGTTTTVGANSLLHCDKTN